MISPTIPPFLNSHLNLSCSTTQQFAYASLPRTSISPPIFATWLARFKHVAILSALCHILTILSCLGNVFWSSGSKILWLGGVALTVAHVYPFRRGLKFMRMAEKGTKLTQNEVREMIDKFVSINGERLVRFDIPGWVCVLGAVVMGNG